MATTSPGTGRPRCGGRSALPRPGPCPAAQKEGTRRGRSGLVRTPTSPGSLVGIRTPIRRRAPSGLSGRSCGTLGTPTVLPIKRLKPSPKKTAHKMFGFQQTHWLLWRICSESSVPRIVACALLVIGRPSESVQVLLADTTERNTAAGLDNLEHLVQVESVVGVVRPKIQRLARVFIVHADAHVATRKTGKRYGRPSPPDGWLEHCCANLNSGGLDDHACRAGTVRPAFVDRPDRHIPVTAVCQPRRSVH
jgi:hypothetical protein